MEKEGTRKVKVKLHTCFRKDEPLSPKKCRCRKYVTVEEALKLITTGTAQFIIKKYVEVLSEEICFVCGGDEKLAKNCSFCLKTGKVNVLKKIPVFGEDIISSVQDAGKKKVNAIKKKTPRSPTIESKHIHRGLGLIGNGQDAARNRWDEYELLTLKERIRLLVSANTEEFETAWKAWEIDTSKPFPLPLRQEPKDDIKTGSGRFFDFGRPV